MLDWYFLTYLLQQVIKHKFLYDVSYVMRVRNLRNTSDFFALERTLQISIIQFAFHYLSSTRIEAITLSTISL